MNHEKYLTSTDVIDDNRIEHHGILGMKWGIRRYQNPDGSLTAFGKKHYDKAQAAIEKFNQQKEKAIAKGNVDFAKKNMDYLSNQDLQRFSDRIKARTSLDSLQKDSTKVTAEKLQQWSSMLNSASNMTGSAITLYNTVAKINNSFSKGKKIPLIKDGEEKAEAAKSITRIFDPDNFKTQETTTFTDAKGNKVTETRHFKPKDNTGDASKTESKSSEPQRVVATVEGKGNSEGSHAKGVSGKTWTDAKYKEAPSTGTAIVPVYKTTTSSSSKPSSPSSGPSSSGGFKGFKDNMTESAKKGMKDVDDYTEEQKKKMKHSLFDSKPMSRDEFYAAVYNKKKELEHGEWKKHKYIRIENGRYIYPEDMEKLTKTARKGVVYEKEHHPMSNVNAIKDERGFTGKRDLSYMEKNILEDAEEEKNGKVRTAAERKAVTEKAQRSSEALMNKAREDYKKVVNKAADISVSAFIDNYQHGKTEYDEIINERIRKEMNSLDDDIRSFDTDQFYTDYLRSTIEKWEQVKNTVDPKIRGEIDKALSSSNEDLKEYFPKSIFKVKHSTPMSRDEFYAAVYDYKQKH